MGIVKKWLHKMKFGFPMVFLIGLFFEYIDEKTVTAWKDPFYWLIVFIIAGIVELADVLITHWFTKRKNSKSM